MKTFAIVTLLGAALAATAGFLRKQPTCGTARASSSSPTARPATARTARRRPIRGTRSSPASTPTPCYKSLLDYQTGARKNAVMGAMAKPLSKADMQNLSAYIATLPGPLSHTASRARRTSPRDGRCGARRCLCGGPSARQLDSAPLQTDGAGRR